MSKFTQNKNQKEGTGSKLSVGYFVACTLLVSLGFYVWQTNNIMASGYHVRDLEKKIAILNETNKALDYQVAQLRSLENVQNRISQMDLVKIDNIEYFKTTSAIIAQK